jgi:hypothetical protein
VDRCGRELTPPFGARAATGAPALAQAARASSPSAHDVVIHDDVVRYVRFLRGKSAGGRLTGGLLSGWFSVLNNCALLAKHWSSSRPSTQPIAT